MTLKSPHLCAPAGRYPGAPELNSAAPVAGRSLLTLVREPVFQRRAHILASELACWCPATPTRKVGRTRSRAKPVWTDSSSPTCRESLTPTGRAGKRTLSGGSGYCRSPWARPEVISAVGEHSK